MGYFVRKDVLKHLLGNDTSKINYLHLWGLLLSLSRSTSRKPRNFTSSLQLTYVDRKFFGNTFWEIEEDRLEMYSENQ